MALELEQAKMILRIRGRNSGSEEVLMEVFFVSVLILGQIRKLILQTSARLVAVIYHGKNNQVRRGYGKNKVYGGRVFPQF